MDQHNPGNLSDISMNVGSVGSSYSISGNIMLSAIIIVLCIVVIMVCLHLYTRWYLIRARRRNRLRNLHRRSQLVFYVDPSSLQSSGLDAAVLKTIPVFCYDSKTLPDDESPECAVCLSEFEESEKVRKLPKCGHHFHVECIDMWFHSHSTCPLCRSMVEPVENSIEVVVEPAQVHDLPGSTSSSPSNGGAAIPVTTSFGSRRNLSFSIEVPKREGCLEELQNEISASQSFKSPGSTIMRILSRGLSMSSSAGTTGGNVNTPSYGGGELDTEKGESETRISQAESSP